MSKTKKPAAGQTRQGFGIENGLSNSVSTAAHLELQDEFSPAAWLAARSRVAVETAKLYAELNRFGGAHG